MNTRQPPPAADFDGALEYCVTEIQAGRMTLDECLDLYHELATRLEPLLKLAAVTITAPHPAMPPDARRALEQQLRARLASLPAQQRARRSSLVRWVSVAAAALLAVVVVSAGTVAAAAGSLPGEFLYPVKRWTEAVSLQVAGDADRADLHLGWARRRLDEFAALAARGVVDATLLDGVTGETEAAIESSDVLDGSRQIAALTRAAGLRMTALEVVSDVRVRAPDAAQPGLDRALADLERAYERALDRLPPLPASSPTPTRTPRPTRTAKPPQSERDEVATPTPPGRGTPGGGQDATPPGRGTPGSGPPDAPPGQDSNPANDKKP